MRKILLMAAGTLSTFTLIFGACAGAASAAQVMPANDYNWSLCWGGNNDSSNGCLWTDGDGNLGAIQDKPVYIGGIAQTWDLLSAECGTVGNGCNPFPDGSGLNSDYTGGKIYTIENAHYGNCIVGINGLPQEGSCTGSNGEVWIAYNIPSTGFYLINVSFTNQIWGTEHITHKPEMIVGCVQTCTEGNLEDVQNGQSTWEGFTS